jgi:predicted Zn-dependent protease
MWAGHADHAVQILKVNTREYPESPNVFDSLGDALAATGEARRAIESYEAALALDPEAKHTREKLRKLEQAEQ